ncbi:hypothetical protein PoB_000599200 [Plakobranchus ocellatus]|uniref:Uncharacterized protein n=1 Tax=Plakobranchus ocellatus TaxID=259542 RepID=A0AAV3Y9L0_9GAST|nr:hypothetical protein PoB_000599200 [Plakobranchus ocellatus]
MGHCEMGHNIDNFVSKGTRNSNPKPNLRTMIGEMRSSLISKMDIGRKKRHRKRFKLEATAHNTSLCYRKVNSLEDTSLKLTTEAEFKNDFFSPKR